MFGGVQMNAVKKASLGDEGMLGAINDRPVVANMHPHAEHSVGYAGKSYTNHGIDAFHITHSERNKAPEHTFKQ